jgi:hypothetical protein
MNQAIPEFTTTSRPLAAYLFTTRALKYRCVTKTTEDTKPVQWHFADPDGIGPKLAEDFRDGSALVSASKYVTALNRTYFTVRRFRERPQQSAPATDERTAPGFKVPAEWLQS